MRVVGVLGLALLPSCGGAEEPTEETISEEVFMEAYMDLRLAALAEPEGELPQARRDSILEAHGITGDDLLTFVEVRGSDVQYMKTLWDSMDARLDRGADEDGDDRGGAATDSSASSEGA